MVLKQINEVSDLIKKNLPVSPIDIHDRLSTKYGANIYLKREDLLFFNSSNLRGVFHAIYQQTINSSKNFVCYEGHIFYKEILISCCLLKRNIAFFVSFDSSVEIRKEIRRQILKLQKHPVSNEIENFIKYVQIDSSESNLKIMASAYSNEFDNVLINNFDISQMIVGQSVIGLELINNLYLEIDYVFVPIDTGLTAASLCLYFKQKNNKTKIIGVKSNKIKKNIDHDKTNIIEAEQIKEKWLVNINEIYYELIDGIVYNKTVESSTSFKTFFEENFELILGNCKTIKCLETYRNAIKGKNIVCLINNLFD